LHRLAHCAASELIYICRGASRVVYDDCPTDTRMRKADKVSIMYAKYTFGHASESMPKRVTQTNRTFSKVGPFCSGAYLVHGLAAATQNMFLEVLGQ
jgi:hypothetical protein